MMHKTAHQTPRQDFKIISDWISSNAQVLDLGCADGSLMRHLQDTKNIHGYGLEREAKNIAKCIDNNINVIQMNLNDGLPSFEDKTFDYVVLSLTLQSIKHATDLVDEMLRVGEEAIVSFPNFGHWSIRLQLALGGKMPVSKRLPYKWHDTPNIRLSTVHDFEEFCDNRNIQILESRVLNNDYKTTFIQQCFPNLFGSIAMFRLSRKTT
ncbi:MAG: methionine biosynthesis protein MetW [Arenicella sp.]